MRVLARDRAMFFGAIWPRNLLSAVEVISASTADWVCVCCAVAVADQRVVPGDRNVEQIMVRVAGRAEHRAARLTRRIVHREAVRASRAGFTEQLDDGAVVADRRRGRSRRYT